MGAGKTGGTPVSGKRQKQGWNGNISTPKDGPRSRAVGAKEIGSGKDSGRGTRNPVK